MDKKRKIIIWSFCVLIISIVILCITPITAYSDQDALVLIQLAARTLIDIFQVIAWNIFDSLFSVLIRWLGRDAAVVLEVLIATGLAIATYIYMKKFVGGPSR